jgi:hypothetical protein
MFSFSPWSEPRLHALFSLWELLVVYHISPNGLTAKQIINMYETNKLVIVVHHLSD